MKEGTGCADLDFLGFACCLQFPEDVPPDFHCGLVDLHPDWQLLGVHLPLHPDEYFSSFVSLIAIWLVRHEIPVQIKFASPWRLRIFNFFFSNILCPFVLPLNAADSTHLLNLLSKLYAHDCITYLDIT